jgi:serine/threonine-protein kinase
MPDNETLDTGVKAGEILAGKYRVERVLGSGGMGVVVAAHHLQLDEKVAIKFLLQQALSREAVLARFEREARAAVKIKSEHVARVIDVGRLESGAPYMVMEYLEGGDLRAWLDERGPMSVEQASEFVLQACEAIAEAHTLGIVHRDLKPGNLFCVKRADGLLSIKVLDFGISKVTAGTNSGADFEMTGTTELLGSPVYMSPEQLKSSKEVDARADIWSLGVILFELVSGQLPFTGQSLTELLLTIVSEPTPSLRALCADLPEGFEHVVARCLAKDRDARIQDVAQLAVALRGYAPARCGASVDRILRTIRPSGAALVSPPTSTDPGLRGETVSADMARLTVSAWGQSRPGRAPPTTKRILGALVAVALVGSAAAVWLAHGKAPATIAAPTAAPDPTAAMTLAPAESIPPLSLAPSASTATAGSLDAPARPSLPPGAGAGKKKRVPTPAPVASPAATVAPSAPTCEIVTDYDAQGQPHFRQVCH